LEEELKSLMQELGNAINESLSDSDRIAAAIGEIRRAGYDVFLVLEATIGFNKRDESAEDEEEEAPAAGEASAPEETERPVQRITKSTGKLRWTSQDHKFLRALKIAIDEDSSK
jgi:hypothetical protein